MGFSTGRRLPRYAPKPGCQVTTSREGPRAAGRGNERRRVQRSDAGDREKATRVNVTARMLGDSLSNLVIR